MKYIPTL